MFSSRRGPILIITSRLEAIASTSTTHSTCLSSLSHCCHGRGRSVAHRSATHFGQRDAGGAAQSTEAGEEVTMGYPTWPLALDILFEGQLQLPRQTPSEPNCQLFSVNGTDRIRTWL